jgi:membrane protease YdiL (CAAX protease family)
MTQSTQSGNRRTWPPAFRGGVEPLVAFVVVIGGLLVVTNFLVVRLLGPDPSRIANFVATIPWKVVEAGLAVAVLRYESVRLRDIGLSPRLFLPALITVAGVVVLLNAVVAGLVPLRGGELLVAAFAPLQSPPLDYSGAELAVGAVVHYLFVGPAEELAFRGYLQNKLVALVGRGGNHARTALGIVAAGAVFSLAHVPAHLFGGGNPAGLALLVLSGIGFGIVYEATRNLYLVAFLHGFGNHWPLFVTPNAWPNWAVIAAVYAVVVLAYRQWAVRTPRPTHGIGAGTSEAA